MEEIPVHFQCVLFPIIFSVVIIVLISVYV